MSYANSPISSRKIVLPSAARKQPIASYVLPVNAPLRWPNSWLEKRVPTIDVQSAGRMVWLRAGWRREVPGNHTVAGVRRPRYQHVRIVCPDPVDLATETARLR